MINKFFLKIAGAVIIALTLSSCLALKSYKKPDINTSNLYPFQRVALDSTTLANMPWQKMFEDHQLQDLINEALKNNLNLKSAIQQIRIAEANFYASKMSLFPSLNLGASVSENETSDNSTNFGGSLGNVSIPASEQYSVSLSSSWLVDIWGQLTSAKRANLASLLQTEATRRAIQTRLVSDVAKAYYRLLALDKKLKITQQTVKIRKVDVKTIKALKKGALANGVAVQQSIANRYAAQVRIPKLKQAIIEQVNALDILLGREPGHISRTSLAQQHPLDTLATGVPAQLLRNRPDVIAAEYSFRQAFAMTNHARTYFYPSLTLTAQGGVRSLKTANLFSPGSIFYNLVAGLTQPIFNKGKNKARLKRAKARQKQALYNLKNTLLDAGRDVTNELAQIKHARQRLKFNQKRVNALKKAVKFSRKLLQFGPVNYTQVLTAQQNLLSAQISHVNAKLLVLTAGVNLYQALGGGWKNWKGVGRDRPAKMDTTQH